MAVSVCFIVGNFALVSQYDNGTAAGKDHPPSDMPAMAPVALWPQYSSFFGKFNAG
jgi:hypothetical protein